VIVSNATTLITFARAGQLGLLRQAIKRLVIPEAVYEDVVLKGTGKPGAEEVKTADWIEVRAVTNRRQVEKLRQILGRGELVYLHQPLFPRRFCRVYPFQGY